MRYWRLIVLAVLLAAPTLLLIVLGIVRAAELGWWFWLGWGMLACFGLAYFLGWYWQRRRQLLRVDFDVPLHWTERDREAWKLVEARAKTADNIPADKLSDPEFYLQTAREMGLELARFYKPKAQDPLASLTIPEILAVIELASHDLSQMVDTYVPGGHLLTVNDWRRAKQVADWYQTATNIGWLISSLFSPVNTGLRYLASQVGVRTPFQKLQFNLLVWFYGAFVHRLGTYLIDLHSGRLRVGAGRYRQLVRESQAVPAPQPDGDGAEAARPVILTVFGQVKMGKSSLINALLGEQRAKTDVIRATAEITRYQLQPEGVPGPLQILDTVGYAHTGPGADQLRATQDAAAQSDLLLLVMHARNPARQADLDMLKALRKYFHDHPDLKMPPVLGVLTHIDLLSPMMEWSPPYNVDNPQRPKEKQIVEAVAAVRDQLGEYLAGVVPVCTAPDKVYGVEEWLLPANVELLDQARAVALLRCLKAEADTGKIRKVFSQLLAAGKEGFRILGQAVRK